MKVSPAYNLSQEEHIKKKNFLIGLARIVSESIHRDITPECYILSSTRYKDGVDEIMHLELGEKSIHCLIIRTEGIRKKKKVYEFCYHHRGFCPHVKKLMLKRKTL